MVMMPMIWYVDKDEIAVPTHRCNLHQWDLGEFDQKGAVATKWGTKDQLTRACSIARQHGVGPVITAVLNVRDLERSILIPYPYSTTNSKSLARTGQNDSWQSESTQGIDSVRSRKRRKSVYVIFSSVHMFSYHAALTGMDCIQFSWKTRKGSTILISQSFISHFLEQYSKMKWTQEHFTGQLCCPFVGSIMLTSSPF